MVQGDGAMKTRMAGRKRTREKQTAGQEIIASLNEAIRWAKGEEVRFASQPFTCRNQTFRCHPEEQSDEGPALSF